MRSSLRPLLLSLPLVAACGIIGTGSSSDDDDDDGGGGVGWGSGGDEGGDEGGSGSGSGSGSGGDDGGGDGACSEVANLELVPLDIWGRDLSGTDLDHDAEGEELPGTGLGPGVQLVALDGAQDIEVRVTADDHLDLELVIEHDGSGGLEVDEPEVGRVATSSETRTISGESCPVFTVYLGLDHAWMAAQGRAPTDNRVEFLMDGEEFWEAVADDLDGASDRVSWATWWWQSDFELVRDPWYSAGSESQRWENTAMGMLEDLDHTERRVLVNRFWADNLDWLEYLNTDSELRDAAEDPYDDLEVVLQGNDTEVELYGTYDAEPASWSFVARVLENPRYADRDLDAPPPEPVPVDLEVQVASWHQKFLVVDGEVAFISGMNTKGTDWDTSAHHVFDPLRMDFDADYTDREDVYYGEDYPDLGPRKDYGARIEGPAARDAEEIFWERWEAALDEDALYSEYASAFSLDDAPSEPSGGVLTQVVATMPEPWADLSIYESHRKAILQAEDLIYIEDQYFRAPMLEDAVIEAMDANPDLVLIVVTKPVSTLDGGARYTAEAHATFSELYPDRYLLLQLRTWALVLEEGTWYDEAWIAIEDMDTHSKLRIVDDRYVSLGSCNWNNRGYKYEGELNVTVLDEDFASEARERVLENLVGPDWDDYLSGVGTNDLDVLALAAESNAEIEAWWDENDWYLDLDEASDTWDYYSPSGFVYPLDIEYDWWFDVGPDAF